MDERQQTRTLLKSLNVEPSSYLIAGADGTVTVVHHRSASDILASGGEGTMRKLGHQWNVTLRNIGFMSRWIGRLDPTLSVVFDGMRVPPTPLDPTHIDEAYKTANDVFYGLLVSLPGTMMEKYVEMGSPPLLGHMCGAHQRPLTDAEYTQEVAAELRGIRPEPNMDGRLKAIIEPATGKSWPSASHLSRELGCATGTLYNHLRDSGIQPLVQGRRFEYAPPSPPDPRLPSNWTEAQKEQARQLARECGMEATF